MNVKMGEHACGKLLIDRFLQSAFITCANRCLVRSAISYPLARVKKRRSAEDPTASSARFLSGPTLNIAATFHHLRKQVSYALLLVTRLRG